METEVKIEIDTATGLPVVPEGFFWRVADDAYGDPIVSLMERRLTKVRKYRTFLGLDLGLGFKYVDEMADVVESSRGFEGLARNPEEVPTDATKVSQTHSGSGVVYRYTEPVNEETIAARAIEIMKCRLRAEESEKAWLKLKAEREALKAKYYGDYPPKKLGE